VKTPKLEGVHPEEKKLGGKGAYSALKNWNGWL